MHLEDVDGSEVAVQAMEAPGSQGELQEPDQAVDRVVDGHHAPKVLGAKERPEDGEVAGVQEEAPRAPHDEGHDLPHHVSEHD